MINFRSFLALLVTITLFACNAQTSDKIKTVSATEFANNINTAVKPQIIDVRTPGEYSAGYIKNATNIDWLGDAFEAETESLDKKKPVYVYCKSGNRSSKAVKKLEELGFTQIVELKGGISEWTNNYPITTDTTTDSKNTNKG
ncbi:rhodanese-like domain-containing protein [Flavobacterium kayseriense]|uniref:rhodanese-like domain-containing protein n=1 Tax=Flavobacterium kayseriense TaxID=2764714 RepID=UPI001C9B94FF|nr:rhodanese-like domain-containing protein [Flavobacterium kayseriense]